MIFGVDTATVIVSTISAIVVSVVGIFLSSKLTGRRNRDHARWERTGSAYNDVLGSLSRMSWINGELLEEIELRREPSESYSAHRSELFLESMNAIRRASAIANLHMSSKTKDALSTLMRIYDEPMYEDLRLVDWFAVFENRREALIKAIAEIKKEADSAWYSR